MLYEVWKLCIVPPNETMSVTLGLYFRNVFARFFPMISEIGVLPTMSAKLQAKWGIPQSRRGALDFRWNDGKRWAKWGLWLAVARLQRMVRPRIPGHLLYTVLRCWGRVGSLIWCRCIHPVQVAFLHSNPRWSACKRPAHLKKFSFHHAMWIVNLCVVS